MTLSRYPNSYAVRNGGCGALLDEETECELRSGHLLGDLPHRSHGPRSLTSYVEYDDDGVVVNRVGPLFARHSGGVQDHVTGV